MSDPAIYQESYTTAALDGARIAAGTAALLVSMDTLLPDEQRVVALDCLAQAQQWLDAARAAMPTATTTSVHIVRPNDGGIIVP